MGLKRALLWPQAPFVGSADDTGGPASRIPPPARSPFYPLLVGVSPTAVDDTMQREPPRGESPQTATGRGSVEYAAALPAGS